MTIRRRITAAAVAAWTALATAPVAGQSVAARTPNLLGGWTAPAGVIQFNFLHRFSVTDPPLRKVLNTPTFNVGTGLTDRIMVGFLYGSNSTLVPAYPNEWELYARAMPLARDRGAPLDVSVQGGYNVASESIDGEVLVSRDFGRLRVLGAGRAFSEAYDGKDARFAVSGGAVVQLTPSLSLGADYGVLLDREDSEPPAWGAGLQLSVPYTPHSFSLHASNVGTASLEGASRGTRTRWGFEYTIPISVRRYLPSGGDAGGEPMGAMAPGEPMRRPAAMAMAGSDTVFVDIENLAFGEGVIEVAPGTTVVWRNADPLQHTVTADDGSFDSGLIDPEGSFSLTFSEAGTYAYHCTPHPFMKARVVVGEMESPAASASGGEEMEAPAASASGGQEVGR